ncbi:MAG: TrmH family RNA methyltransferase, partial [Lentisphaeria bacterium]
MEELTSNQRKLINKLTSARSRKKSGYFLCEGKRACQEALESMASQIYFAVVTMAERASIDSDKYPFPVAVVADKEFGILADTSTPQGIMLIIKEPELELFDGNLVDDFVLVLDQVTDPGNFGTIVRTAWAAGLKEVWYTTGTTDPYGAKCVRSGMGAHFNMNFRRFDNLEQIEEIIGKWGGKLCLTKPQGKVSCFSEDFKFAGNAVVMGNEANGIEYCS